MSLPSVALHSINKIENFLMIRTFTNEEERKLDIPGGKDELMVDVLKLKAHCQMSLGDKADAIATIK
jgi:hypothetical protein